LWSEEEKALKEKNQEKKEIRIPHSAFQNPKCDKPLHPAFLNKRDT
jgi:hypothetical protein